MKSQEELRKTIANVIRDALQPYTLDRVTDDDVLITQTQINVIIAQAQDSAIDFQSRRITAVNAFVTQGEREEEEDGRWSCKNMVTVRFISEHGAVVSDNYYFNYYDMETYYHTFDNSKEE